MTLTIMGYPILVTNFSTRSRSRYRIPLNLSRRPIAEPVKRVDFDKTAAAFQIDAVIVLILLCCFGSIVALTIKVQQLKEAPNWAVLLYLLPIALSAIACAIKPHIAVRTALLGGPYFLLVLWAFASFQWSNQPALTMRQGLLFICTYMSACALAMNLSWFRIARILALLFSTQAVISAALAILKPDWGVMTEIYPGAWSGIWNFKQSLGVSMAVGAGCVSGYTLLNPKAWFWTGPALLVIILCVVQSEATTAILVTGLAIGMPFSAWLAQRHPSAAVFSIWAVTLGIIFSALALTVLAPVIFQALGKAPTLTGRTDIWAALEPAIQARPTLGWGFQAFWTDTSLSSPVEEIERAMDGFRPPDAHSTPTDIRLQLGIVGSILAILAFARCWLQAILQAGREPGMMVVLGFLTAISGMCFTESLALYPMDSMTLVAQVILIKTTLSLWDYKDDQKGRPILI
jgi:exopolysaccharide production protein ExoQ